MLELLHILAQQRRWHGGCRVGVVGVAPGMLEGSAHLPLQHAADVVSGVEINHLIGGRDACGHVRGMQLGIRLDGLPSILLSCLPVFVQSGDGLGVVAAFEGCGWGGRGGLFRDWFGD